MALLIGVVNFLWFIFIFEGIGFITCYDQTNFYSITSRQSSHNAVTYCNFTGAALFCRNNSSNIDREFATIVPIIQLFAVWGHDLPI